MGERRNTIRYLLGKYEGNPSLGKKIRVDARTILK
jgi:hypothetical protein